VLERDSRRGLASGVAGMGSRCGGKHFGLDIKARDRLSFGLLAERDGFGTFAVAVAVGGGGRGERGTLQEVVAVSVNTLM
jgi:hypothetical protein